MILHEHIGPKSSLPVHGTMLPAHGPKKARLVLAWPMI